jgi:hypothetical protein
MPSRARNLASVVSAAGNTSVISVGTTTQRPAVTSNGVMRINSTTNSLEIHYNGNWFIVASLQGNFALEYVIVAGGGGGGTNAGAGGGAGGVIYSSTIVSPGSTYTITIGAGGSGGGAVDSAPAGTGGNSSVTGGTLTGLTAYGGGGGIRSGGSGANGGSGGGGAASGSGGKGVYPGSTYISATRQGYDGGAGGGTDGAGRSGAGGGGAGAAGANQGPGAGGIGIANPFSQSTVGQLSSGVYYLAGGGGGSPHSGAGASGGLGGGGTGGTGNTSNGTAGTANTGGGGGAGGGYSYLGANGGSGVVIFRVPVSVTGSYTGGGSVTSSGDFKLYTFTASGTLTI